MTFFIKSNYDIVHHKNKVDLLFVLCASKEYPKFESKNSFCSYFVLKKPCDGNHDIKTGDVTSSLDLQISFKTQVTACIVTA